MEKENWNTTPEILIIIHSKRFLMNKIKIKLLIMKNPGSSLVNSISLKNLSQF